MPNFGAVNVVGVAGAKFPVPCAMVCPLSDTLYAPPSSFSIATIRSFVCPGPLRKTFGLFHVSPSAWTNTEFGSASGNCPILASSTSRSGLSRSSLNLWKMVTGPVKGAGKLLTSNLVANTLVVPTTTELVNGSVSSERRCSHVGNADLSAFGSQLSSNPWSVSSKNGPGVCDCQVNGGSWFPWKFSMPVNNWFGSSSHVCSTVWSAVGKLQYCVVHAAQVPPPQSIPVSSWFCRPSLQVGSGPASDSRVTLNPVGAFGRVVS